MNIPFLWPSQFWGFQQFKNLITIIIHSPYIIKKYKYHNICWQFKDNRFDCLLLSGQLRIFALKTSILLKVWGSSNNVMFLTSNLRWCNNLGTPSIDQGMYYVPFMERDWSPRRRLTGHKRATFQIRSATFNKQLHNHHSASQGIFISLPLSNNIVILLYSIIRRIERIF